MANYSAAFGYKFYIMPLKSEEVDLTFTGITTATGTSATTAFMKTDDSALNDEGNLVLTGDTVSYDTATGIFTVETAAFDMDGLDKPAKLTGLTNASLETDTSSEDVTTYDRTTRGYNTNIATTKSFSISLEGVADFKDAAYQILRLTEANTVNNSLRVKFARIGPTGTDEAIYGYGTLEGYSESIEAGSVVSYSATLNGYGPYNLLVDANA
tara:strand:+ start:6673 stop:7308 length:636 start_codon:yes stop_codon:yes gene_type:complete